MFLLHYCYTEAILIKNIYIRILLIVIAFVWKTWRQPPWKYDPLKLPHDPLYFIQGVINDPQKFGSCRNTGTCPTYKSIRLVYKGAWTDPQCPVPLPDPQCPVPMPWLCSAVVQGMSLWKCEHINKTVYIYRVRVWREQTFHDADIQNLWMNQFLQGILWRKPQLCHY